MQEDYRENSSCYFLGKYSIQIMVYSLQIRTVTCHQMPPQVKQTHNIWITSTLLVNSLVWPCITMALLMYGSPNTYTSICLMNNSTWKIWKEWTLTITKVVNLFLKKELQSHLT